MVTFKKWDLLLFGLVLASMHKLKKKKKNLITKFVFVFFKLRREANTRPKTSNINMGDWLSVTQITFF